MSARNFLSRLPRRDGELIDLLGALPAEAFAPLAAFFAELAAQVADRDAAHRHRKALEHLSELRQEHQTRLAAALDRDPEAALPAQWPAESHDWHRTRAERRRRARAKQERNDLIWREVEAGRSLAEIGRRVGLHPVTVSRIVARRRAARLAVQKQQRQTGQQQGND